MEKELFGLLALAIAGLAGAKVIQAWRGVKSERAPIPIPKPLHIGDDVQRRLADVELEVAGLQRDVKYLTQWLEELKDTFKAHELEDRTMHERISRMEGAAQHAKDAVDSLVTVVRDFREFAAVVQKTK